MADVMLKRRSLRLDRNALALVLPAIVLVLILFIYPLIYGLMESFSQENGGGWTLSNYIQFFSDERQVRTILTTFQVALPVTLFSVIVSVPLAYYMRRGIRLERLITILLILPITLGSVMVSLAMETYFGPIGWFNRVLEGIGLLHAPAQLTHNFIGVEISLFIQGFPFTFLMIVGYMSAINSDLERASRMLGANAWQTFWRIVLPLSLPGIAIAFCLNFVANFGVFPTAQLIGQPTGDTRVLAVAAYETAFEDLHLPLGTAIVLIMGALQLLVIAFVLWLRSRLARTSAISGGKGA